MQRFQQTMCYKRMKTHKRLNLFELILVESILAGGFRRSGSLRAEKKQVASIAFNLIVLQAFINWYHTRSLNLMKKLKIKPIAVNVLQCYGHVISVCSLVRSVRLVRICETIFLKISRFTGVFSS